LDNDIRTGAYQTFLYIYTFSFIYTLKGRILVDALNLLNWNAVVKAHYYLEFLINYGKVIGGYGLTVTVSFIGCVFSSER
jgi:hypothetical protein